MSHVLLNAPHHLPAAETRTDHHAVRDIALDRYQLLELLHCGPCNLVYAGYDPDLRRTLALKVPRFEFATDPDGEGAHRRHGRGAGAAVSARRGRAVGGVGRCMSTSGPW